MGDEQQNGGGARRRTTARLAAVQALYQIELTAAPVEQVIGEFGSAKQPIPDGEDAALAELVQPDPRLFTAIVEGVVAHRGELDEKITAALTKSWSLDRLEILVRLILEAGVFEMTMSGDVPPKVAINEYMNIAHAFFDGAEPGFINGVLDTIASLPRS